MFNCIFSLETLKKLEKLFFLHCYLIPGSPCNLCLSWNTFYVLIPMLYLYHSKCSYLSMPSRKSFGSHQMDSELPWLYPICVIELHTIYIFVLVLHTPTCSNF